MGEEFRSGVLGTGGGGPTGDEEESLRTLTGQALVVVDAGLEVGDEVPVSNRASTPLDGALTGHTVGEDEKGSRLRGEGKGGGPGGFGKVRGRWIDQDVTIMHNGGCG
jgi:hypothetical protein